MSLRTSSICLLWEKNLRPRSSNSKSRLARFTKRLLGSICSSPRNPTQYQVPLLRTCRTRPIQSLGTSLRKNCLNSKFKKRTNMSWISKSKGQILLVVCIKGPQILFNKKGRIFRKKIFYKNIIIFHNFNKWKAKHCQNRILEREFICKNRKISKCNRKLRPNHKL